MSYIEEPAMFHCFICLLPIPELVKFFMKLLRCLIAKDMRQIGTSVFKIKCNVCLWSTFLVLAKCHIVKPRAYFTIRSRSKTKLSNAL